MSDGNIWPRAITAVFVVFFLGLVAFVVFAMRRPSELVTPDYYERELRHEEQIERERRGREPGVCTITLDATTRRLTLAFDTVPGGGTVQFYRPSAAALDRRFPVGTDTNGVQVIDLSGCASGLWTVQILWTRDGLEYYREDALVLP